MPTARSTRTIRLGTRSSKLARWQADWTAEQLRANGADVEIVFITTEGDQFAGSIQNSPERGLFTKRIQRALQENEIDLAVHSLKDLPTEPIEGLSLAAIPQRENPADVLVSRNGQLLAALPPQAKIGTGSWRRQSQLLYHRSDLQIEDIRGNVDTRLRKLHEGKYDAIVLAFAGLHRLGLDDQITQHLDFQTLLPAVGQGALGLEIRTDDQSTRDIVDQLTDQETKASVSAERSMLHAIGGGCLAPVGAYGRVESGKLFLHARVLTHDGKQMIEHELSDDPSNAEKLGEQVAQKLIADGAQDLIQHSRESGS